VSFVIIKIISYILNNQENMVFLHIREKHKKEMGAR